VLIKTKGIVIKTIKYGDTSAICNIFTKEMGVVGFHLPGVFSNKGKFKLSFIQIFNLVEISFNYNKNKNLQRLSDISCLKFPMIQSYQHQAFFSVCSEVIQQSLKENEINDSLFNYIENHVLNAFDQPMHFWQLPYTMLNLLYYYGCAPNLNGYQEGDLLDMQEGVFGRSLLSLKFTADAQSSLIIYNLLCNKAEHIEQNHHTRHQVIEDLIIYFKLHVNEFFELKSREVWQEMLSNR
jgi:DNA repair protein RecO (recombination protein O)